MPEVNLIHDTQSPDLPPKPPKKPGQPEMTDPTAGGGGFGKMFRSMLGHSNPTLGQAKADKGRMGLGKSKPDQRIINEKRSSRPAVIPLPEDDDNFDVNLLSEDLVSSFKPRMVLLSLVGWMVGAAAVVGLAYFGLSLADRSIANQITTKRTELAQVRQQIDDLKGEQKTIQQTTQKISAIRRLIDDHVHWTNMFAKLEHYTLPEVFYGTSFAADINGSLTLGARTDTYEHVAQQYLVFEQAVANGDFISSFDITGATRTTTELGDQVTFSVNLQILPSVFQDQAPTTDTTS